MRSRVGIVGVLCIAAGCADDAGSSTPTVVTTATSPAVTTSTTASTTTTPSATTTTEFVYVLPSTTYVEVELVALREELLVMFREDQMERTGVGLPPGTKIGPIQDYKRAQRLKEIIVEFGWPTVDMVGTDGAQAAWLIAQHADHDVTFQQYALELMRVAVAAGQADASEFAFLQDRVAVNTGQPQTYGSQIRCRSGAPEPATPLSDPVRIDEIRATVGLEPLADYYAQFEMGCRSEQAAAEATTTASQ